MRLNFRSQCSSPLFPSHEAIATGMMDKEWSKEDDDRIDPKLTLLGNREQEKSWRTTIAAVKIRLQSFYQYNCSQPQPHSRSSSSRRSGVSQALKWPFVKVSMGKLSFERCWIKKKFFFSFSLGGYDGDHLDIEKDRRSNRVPLEKSRMLPLLPWKDFVPLRSK